MGIIPLVAIQIILIMIKVPKEFETLHRRLYQGFGGPLYWISRLLGDQSVHYVISFTVLAFIAGAGYFAGFKDFYLLNFIRQKLGIKRKEKKEAAKK